MRRALRTARLLPLLLVLSHALLFAAPDDTPSANSGRPRLALVLSGGGARGAAHIGVLKVLEEMHVAPDIVVGTSMGSVVGGLYSAGWSPEELERLLREADWDILFRERALRDEKSFRRKQDDATFLVPLKLRFRGLKPYIPSGAVGGQRIDLFLKTLEMESTGERDFDRLPIPYRAVAIDILDGSAVVLGKGSLSRAMRASMAVPALFPPVEIDGRRLLDGGAAANLPIGIAQSLGAETVIAVDITSPLAQKDELESLVSILGQQSSYLTVGNRTADLKRLRPGDVLIRPELGGMSFTDFHKAAEAIAKGEAAARAAEDQLRPFALTDEEWARFQAAHVRHPQFAPLDRVVIENDSRVDDRVVRSRLHIAEGKLLDPEELSEDVLRLRALDYFGTIQPDLTREGGQNILRLPIPRPPYGRNSVQFSLNVYDDFDGDFGYSIAARHQMLAVNRRGGEWQNILQIGDNALLRTEFYQPLDHGMRWFVSPGAEEQRNNFKLWVDGDNVATYRLSIRDGHLAGGRVLGDWGELRAGLYTARGRLELRTGLPSFPDASQKDVGYEVSFRADTLDNTVFPTSGMAAELVFERALEGLGSDIDAKQLRGRAAYVFRFGKNVLVPAAEVDIAFGDDTTVRSTYLLGGFLRLSGLNQNELLGDEGGLVKVVYYNNVMSVGLGALRTPVYVGASVEAGQVYLEGEPVTLSGLEHAGSIFIGADTTLGPIYLALGLSNGGRRQAHFNIGARF